MKIKYPNNHRSLIHEFISNLLNFYKTYDRLASVEILDNLYVYQTDPLNQDRLHDIYEKYRDTKFIVSKLNEMDIEYIKERYIQELKILGKEYE